MRRLHAVLCLSLLTTVGSVSPARAQGTAGATPADKERARQLFDDGVDLERRADYAGALARYKEAEQITATAGLLFHEAYCLELMGKLASALAQYDAADKLARETNKQDVHTAILVRLDPLRARVPQIALRVTTPAHGAEVQVDGVTVAPGFLEGKAFRIDPGEHVVTARAEGYADLTRKVQVPEKVTTTVDLSLHRAASAATPPPVAVGPGADSHEPSGGAEEPPAEPTRRRPLALPIGATAGAVLLAGAGVAFFVVAGGAQSDAQRNCLAKTTCDDERSRVRTFDALALGSFIGAAGLGVLSVVLWSSGSRSSSATGAVAPRAPQARLRVAPATLGLEGTF